MVGKSINKPVSAKLAECGRGSVTALPFSITSGFIVEVLLRNVWLALIGVFITFGLWLVFFIGFNKIRERLKLISIVFVPIIFATGIFFFDVFGFTKPGLISFMYSYVGVSDTKNAEISDDVIIVFFDDASARNLKVDTRRVRTGDYTSIRPLHGEMIKVLTWAGAKRVIFDMGFPRKPRDSVTYREYTAGLIKGLMTREPFGKGDGADVLIGLFSEKNEVTGEMEIYKNDPLIVNAIARRASGVLDVTSAFSSPDYERPSERNQLISRPVCEGHIDIVVFEEGSDVVRAVNYARLKRESKTLFKCRDRPPLETSPSLPLIGYCGYDCLYRVEHDTILIYDVSTQNTIRRIPIDDYGLTYIHFPKRGFVEYNYWGILQAYLYQTGQERVVDERGTQIDKPLEEIFAGKYVVVANAAGPAKHDVVWLPGKRAVHGAYVQGYALSALLLERFLKPTPLWFDILVMFALALSGLFVVAKKSFKKRSRCILLIILAILIIGTPTVGFRYVQIFYFPLYGGIMLFASVLWYYKKRESIRAKMFRNPLDRGNK